MAENDKVIALAEGCGMSAETALGFLVRFWGRVAEHRPDGDLSGMSDQALERWAGWNGMPTVFAFNLRKLFVENELLDGWRERQGKLIEHAAKEKARKIRGRSADNPPLRNSTVVTDLSSETTRNRFRGTSADIPRELNPEGRSALELLLPRIRNAGAFTAELRMIVAGARNVRPTPTWDAVSLALVDLVTADVAEPTPNVLRAFVRKAGETLATTNGKPETFHESLARKKTELLAEEEAHHRAAAQ